MERILDAFTHNVPTNYLRKLKRHPKGGVRDIAAVGERMVKRIPSISDLEVRLKELRKSRIERQATCNFEGIDPNQLPIAPGEQLKLCRVLNDDMAEFMRESKGKIIALGSIPLKSVEEGEGIEEMRRAIKDLDLRGFEIISNVLGAPIDSFGSFWDEVYRLGVPVYIHPNDPISPVGRPYEDEYDLTHVLGWPFESSLAAARLVLSGIIDTHEDLSVVIHHTGAMIPFFAGRINESYRQKMALMRPAQSFDAAKPIGDMLPIDHFRKFYFDTAIGGNAYAVECAYKIFGAERIIFGTDYPFGPEQGRERIATYPDMVRELPGATKGQKERIFYDNSARLLRVED